MKTATLDTSKLTASELSALDATQGGPLQVLPRDDIHTDMIRAALAMDDVDLDRVERLYALKRQNDADLARNAYVNDMAALKASEDLTVIKDRHVKFQTNAGVTEYDHATIGNVVQVATRALGRHGFSHRWDTNQDKEVIRVTCTITHRFGHSESLSLEAKADSSGGKNAIQAIISTKSYLERHSLTGVLGIATKDQEDDDGRTGGANRRRTSGDDDNDVAAQWIQAISEDADNDALATRRIDMENKFGGIKTVPPVILQAWWLRTISLCSTPETADELHKEILAEYGDTTKVPKPVRAAWQARRKELTP